MNNRGFAYAIRAMGALEMYREMYSSGGEYQHELNHVLNTLRMRAETMKENHEISDRNFILAFADALEESNKPTAYVPLSQR